VRPSLPRDAAPGLALHRPRCRSLRATFSISVHFASLTDPRLDRTKLHSLHDILVIAFSAIIAGCDGWAEVEEFAREREDWSLDVTFAEDQSRIRKVHAPANAAMLRRMALNALKSVRGDKRSLKIRRRMCGWSPDYHLKVLMGSRD
jgi:hypothetical protein